MNLKKPLSLIFAYSGLIALRRVIGVRKPTVLMYHKVDKNLFEKHAHLLSKKYNAISLEEFYAYLHDDKKLPKNSVLLTFDDGYLNNYVQAYPGLKKYNVPATMFLTTGFLGKEIFCWYDKAYYLAKHNPIKVTIANKKYDLRYEAEDFLTFVKTKSLDDRDKLLVQLENMLPKKLPIKPPREFIFLTPEQVKRMRPLVDFGGHSITHPILINIPDKLMFEEVEQSVLTVKKFGSIVTSFAYPNGDYNEKVIAAIKKSGVQVAFTTHKARVKQNCDPLLVPRWPINIFDDWRVLDFKLTWGTLLYGKWSPLSFLKWR